MLLKLAGTIFCIIQFTSLSQFTSADQLLATTGDNESARTSGSHDDKSKLAFGDRTIPIAADNAIMAKSDRNFVKDIVDRLHALDADIGKLLYNSSSMYAPNDQSVGQQDGGGEKFTEVLNDLDSLQDEIGVLVSNATRTRQYNILIRLRPLNNILYRIRHNLHLMRNSLVAINAVSSLEKIGNSVLDSTLQAFMRPDANLSDEIGDDGNYDINLDKLELLSNTTTSSTTTTTTTSTTTTPPPQSSSPKTSTTTTITTSTTTTPSTSSTAKQTSTERLIAATNRPTQRTATRRANHRQGQRRTQRPTTAKPDTRVVEPAQH